MELQIGARYNTSHGQNLKGASEEHKYQDVQEYLNPSVYRVSQKTENIPFWELSKEAKIGWKRDRKITICSYLLLKVTDNILLKGMFFGDTL